jgi:pimeloyl-ACP methyl ester carboxylesterase
MANETTLMSTPDGRQLEYLVTGPADGPLLLFHTGTPNPAADFTGVTGPAAALGLRTVSYSRPGYGRSSERPGRSIADAVDDVVALLDVLEVDEFLTFGWSGGGPHALACAALMPDRCRAAALLASVAPYGARGLDFTAGMDQANIDEFAAAIAGYEAMDAFLEPLIEHFQHVTGASVVEGLGELLSRVDKEALTGVFADEMATAMRRAMENGIAGWRDDDLAFVKPWGFALSEIAVPVGLWQGREDRMVPYAHGEWLAREIPGAEPHLFEREGHISLMAQIDSVLADVVRLGGTRAR